MMFLQYVKKYKFVDILFLLTLLLCGGFYEYLSCAAAVAMCVYLLLRLKKEQKLTVRMDLLTAAIFVICLGYGLTFLWAVDRGMAFVGFLKFLPLALYVLCLQQQEDTKHVLHALPWLGAAITVVSGIGMYLGADKELFSVAGRLAGFFQYPNTFAAFLLICELLCLQKPGKKIWDYAVLAVLLAGLLLTGSRTAFVVAILANVAMLVAFCGKNLRKILLLGIAGIVLVAVVLLLGGQSVLNRYLTISFTQSTFVGRLLYWLDALPLLLKYPFGMGYMGYYYVQQSIQTGVYSVAYIHNDFLQLLLDVGIVPAGLLIAAIVRWFFHKDIPLTDKIVVGALCLHSFFEFHLQYIGMFFLLILLLSQKQPKKAVQYKPGRIFRLSLAVIALVCVYMVVALAASNLGAKELSDKLYPYNTQTKLSILSKTEDMEQANALADDILAQNTHFYVPYSVKAQYSYSQGDFGAVIQNQRAALKRNPFLHTEYESYCKMLITGIDLYQKAGDAESAEICRKELLAVAQQLTANAQRLSALGKMIVDQPVIELSDEIQNYINKIGG